MSGHYTPLLVSLGIASCALATLLAHLIGASDDEGLPLHIFARLPAYLLWLIREIITANIATALSQPGGREPNRGHRRRTF